MPKLETQGTKFTFSVLPYRLGEEYWARTSISIQNEFIFYEDVGEYISNEELETLITALSRLLAGGYEREYTVAFETAGLAIDLYAHTKNGAPVSREMRRKNDCVMAVRLLLRSKEKKQFLGGVHTLLFHRKEIENFLAALQAEYQENAFQRRHGTGKYLFVGVSPLGYRGCNYRYFDPSGKAKTGDYVWVRMGRHNTEQIVFVDSARYYDDEDAPYNPQTVKRVLRMATAEEIQEIER